MNSDDLSDMNTSDTSGFRVEKVELDQKYIDEINLLFDKISNGEDPKDIHIRRRLAQVLVNIFENNALSKKSILHYSKLTSRFIQFSFGDELDNILKETLQILNNQDAKDSDAISAWIDIHDQLVNYLAKI